MREVDLLFVYVEGYLFFMDIVVEMIWELGEIY